MLCLVAFLNLLLLGVNILDSIGYQPCWLLISYTPKLTFHKPSSACRAVARDSPWVSRLMGLVFQLPERDVLIDRSSRLQCRPVRMTRINVCPSAFLSICTCLGCFAVTGSSAGFRISSQHLLYAMRHRDQRLSLTKRCDLRL